MISLLAATPHETNLLRRQLPLIPDPRLPGQAFSCRFCNRDILLLHTGIGIASAASSLTTLLEKLSPQLLIAFGCGGSYPASGLQNGDLALATSEYFGDLGAAAEEGFIPLADLGLRQPVAAPALFVQQFDLQGIWLDEAARLLRNADELAATDIACGPFVTVNTVSGTRELCRDLEQRTAGICENMEGAALAQVAERYSAPLLELRGISNPCGTRDSAHWNLPGGMEIAQQAVLRLLKDLPCPGNSLCS
jgi:futalosine hydrolase